MYSLDEGGTEFIVRSLCFYELYTSFILRNIDIFARDRVVAIEGMFYVHGDVINQFMIEEVFNHLGITSVGIELHEKTEGFYLLTKLWEVSVYRRLSSADDNPIQKPDTGFEKSEKYILTDCVLTILRYFFGKYQFFVVAVSTPEITS